MAEAAEGDDANPHHHGSHQDLLDEPDLPTATAVIDAIIVPTARPSAQLNTAIGYARELGCALLALCSKDSSASDVFRLGEQAGIDVVAIDVDKIPADSGLLPDFATTATLATRRRFPDRRDTATKRNLALLFAALVGWERVFFLDDDITVDDVGVLRAAGSALSGYHLAGLRVDEFPDNSVVCHAGRELGRPQQTFIGGGALAVDLTKAAGSFFPQVYNEDWFFLLDDKGLRPTVIAGKARQERYDPYYSRARARYEEVGDTLAEGVFWLLDDGGKVNDATEKHWGMFLDERRAFIVELLDAVDESGLSKLRRMKIRGALNAALRRNRRISAEFCASYLQDWLADRTRWREHVTDWQAKYRAYLHAADRLDDWPPRTALTVLNLLDCARYLRCEVSRSSSAPAV